MSRGFVVDFNRRRSQVKRYLGTVVSADRENRHSSAFGAGKANVLRGGTFLILYNMIESAARQAVQEIHDTMQQRKVPFHELRCTIRREVIRGFKKNGDIETHQHMKDVPVEFVTAALNVEEHFSGNVDARRIKEMAGLYGFSTDTDTTITRDGFDLLVVKRNRNDLAHGHKTYEEVGREYSTKDLLGIALRTTAFVAAILGNVSAYLDRDEFLER